MNNRFEIRGNSAVIYVKCKGKTYEAIIDAEDLPKVNEIKGAWYVRHDTRGPNKFYVYGNDEGKKVFLHRLITECPKGKVVDHINHDTLDNRKSNLRILDSSENIQNLYGAISQNKSSGIRGVTWNKNANKWQVSIKVKSRSMYFGLYSDLKQAEEVAKQARADHMPFSLDALERNA